MFFYIYIYIYIFLKIRVGWEQVRARQKRGIWVSLVVGFPWISGLVSPFGRGTLGHGRKTECGRKLNRTHPQGRGVKVGVARIHFCGGKTKKKCAAGVGVISTVYQAVTGKLPRGRKTKSEPMGGSGHGPLSHYT